MGVLSICLSINNLLSCVFLSVAVKAVILKPGVVPVVVLGIQFNLDLYFTLR